jgi:hypothetical protein
MCSMTGWIVAWMLLVPGGGPLIAETPEARAIRYLVDEVPRWSRENGCFSCHNNGDAAQALIVARQLGHPVPDNALDDTLRWLKKPEGWDHNGGEGGISDRRLARIAFASALATAVETGLVEDRAPLHRVAADLAKNQDPDGSWRLDGPETLGGPTTYGRPLATLLAWETLRVANQADLNTSADKARRWLRDRELKTVLDAAIRIWVLGNETGDELSAQREAALAILRRGQSPDGGWGPFERGRPEVFDTALVVLALAQAPANAELRELRSRGRAYLVANQWPEGGWTETTRPTGGESYAQRISTSGWALRALLSMAE